MLGYTALCFGVERLRRSGGATSFEGLGVGV